MCPIFSGCFLLRHNLMIEHDFKIYKMSQGNQSPAEGLPRTHQAQAGSWCNKKSDVPIIMSTKSEFSNKTFTELHGPLLPKILKFSVCYCYLTDSVKSRSFHLNIFSLNSLYEFFIFVCLQKCFLVYCLQLNFTIKTI